MGSRKQPSRPELPNRKPKAKVTRARRDYRLSTNGQTDKKNSCLVRNSGEEVASLLIGAVNRRKKDNKREKYNQRGRYNQRDWQAWERILKQARQQWESYRAGKLGANSVDCERAERIGLTIDSGYAACALPVGVASAVGMQELDRAPQEYLAANSEKIRELGFKTPTLKFQNGDVQNLKFSVMDKLHKPLVAACKVAAAGNRIVLQPENQGGSFIEDVRSKRRKRTFERNGVYVLPCWLVKQSPQKALGTSG